MKAGESAGIPRRAVAAAAGRRRIGTAQSWAFVAVMGLIIIVTVTLAELGRGKA